MVEKMKVEDYRLQDYDIVQLKNGVIGLYYEYEFIFCFGGRYNINRSHGNVNLHPAFNNPKYTGKHEIEGLTVKKVKHNHNGFVNMEHVLNSFDYQDIDWDIEFD